MNYVVRLSCKSIGFIIWLTGTWGIDQSCIACSTCSKLICSELTIFIVTKSKELILARGIFSEFKLDELLEEEAEFIQDNFCKKIIIVQNFSQLRIPNL